MGSWSWGNWDHRRHPFGSDWCTIGIASHPPFVARPRTPPERRVVSRRDLLEFALICSLAFVLTLVVLATVGAVLAR